jgi:hypothetical protein
VTVYVSEVFGNCTFLYAYGLFAEHRQGFVPDVEIITYDKILETQAAQMSRIFIPDFDESPLRLGGISGRAFRL